MRVVKEFSKDSIRITVLNWNNKYLMKYELGPMEQTFKIPETDILEEANLDTFSEGRFFELVKERFKEMGESLQIQLENL